MNVMHTPLELLLVPSPPPTVFQQSMSAGWRRDYSMPVLKVPITLPGMATFVGTGKPNFRVTCKQEPDPLISYSGDSWTVLYNQNSEASSGGAGGHETRASVIRKTSDVTSS